jgi:hypothetical protein
MKASMPAMRPSKPEPPSQVPAPTRHRPQGVVPVELWDLELSEGILWDHMQGGALPAALVEAIERLRRGTARTRSHTPITALAGEPEALWLAGGRASAIDAERMSAALGLPVWIADDPTAFAEHGARALVPEAIPGGSLAVIDLGQSRLKLYVGGHRFEHERPWGRLPLHGGDIPIAPVTARTALREWVGLMLAEAAAGTGTDPDAVVFALPCELPDAPIPGSSSYPGLQDDADFVADVLAAAGWQPARVLVLNDAELAAVAASLDPRTHGKPTLVLTLGFGVGAALLP